MNALRMSMVSMVKTFCLLSYINSVATKLHSFGITLKKMKLHTFVSIILRPSDGISTFEAKLIFRGIDMGRINPRN